MSIFYLRDREGLVRQARTYARTHVHNQSREAGDSKTEKLIILYFISDERGSTNEMTQLTQRKNVLLGKRKPVVFNHSYHVIKEPIQIYTDIYLQFVRKNS